MDFNTIIQIILLVVLSFNVVVGTFILTVLLLYRFFDAPFVPTKEMHHKKIINALNIKPDSIVYELGSGDGRLLIAMA